ncbi:hypothetical protein BGW39_001157 [Mortierella sp. 14UC]|nr:hypothetical protein BGW39_001157 [Mortierella sp. 14UC]
MQLASEQFRNTVELVAIVVSLLDRQDMLSFRLTCRTVHSVCQQFYFREVRLDDHWTNNSLQELVKYAVTVRSFKADEKSISRYYWTIDDVLLSDPAALLTLLVNNFAVNPSNTVLTNTTEATTSSPWISQLQLATVLSHNNALHTLGRMHHTSAQLLHIVCLSPCLTVLNLGPIFLDKCTQLNLLARVISSIGSLKSLALSFLRKTLSAESILQAIVHSCPPLVDSLSLEMRFPRHGWVNPTPNNSNAKVVEPELVEALSTFLEPPIERKEPLRRLTDWGLIIESTLIDSAVYISLLKYFPEVVSMDVPAILNPNPQEDNEIAAVAQRIVPRCPKLKNLRKRHVVEDVRCQMPFMVADRMPHNTLESFQCTHLQDDKQHYYCLDSRLMYQSRSLKRILLDEIVKVSSSTIRNILLQYPELEVFRVTESPHRRVQVSVAGLIIDPWVCIKLKELQLAASLEYGPTGPDPALLLYSKRMAARTKFVERFYERIGALRALRILDLRVSSDLAELPNSYGRGGFIRTEYRKRTFPGLMLLDDQAAGRRGWLQLLKGLNNLEEVHGSFNLNAMLPGFEFGQREADWMVQHWPSLRFIEFYTRERGNEAVVPLPPAVQSLKHSSTGQNAEE